MLIKTLVENTSISDEFKNQHGLSLYIETEEHKVLFDLGQDNLFLENAKKLKINISEIDTVIISHGHYDHGGGLKEFLKVNNIAKIYLHKDAFQEHYARRVNEPLENIGLDKELIGSERFIFTDDYLKIDEELELFSKVSGNRFIPTSNQDLLKKCRYAIIPDTFDHEQNLIINQGQKTVLFAGCAHKGIVNIVSKAVQMKQKPINFVIGGFHLTNPSRKTSEETITIEQIASCLKDTGAMYYTGHCTGQTSFDTLKKVMKDRLQSISTGSMLEI